MGMLYVIFTSLWKSLHYKAAPLVFFPTYQNKYFDRSTRRERTPAVYLHLFMLFYYV